LVILNDVIWAQKYRPKKISECVLPTRLKATLQKLVDERDVPHMLFVGSSGVGKTTAARAMVEEIGADYIVINASLHGNIDTLRTDIQCYCSSVSLTGGRKYIILDESDYLTPLTQPALRSFMEEFSQNASFILTANYRDRIIPALQSRCAVIDFKPTKAESKKLASEFLKKLHEILHAEGVQYEVAAVAEVIVRYYPDWRRVLNELQAYSKETGRIDSGVLARARTNVDELWGYLRDRDFTGCRRWIGVNLDGDSSGLVRALYDRASDLMTPQSVPQLVLILAKYQDMAARVVDQEINTAAMCVEIMIDTEFKK
jgi:replication factor C small subunit